MPFAFSRKAHSMKPFIFELTPHVPEDCEEPPPIPVTLHLTQRQFADKALVDRLLEREAAKLGIENLAWWHERPPVPAELVAKLREAIDCPADATVIFYYPARLTSPHFSSVAVNGTLYQYSNHPGSRVIKIVPALPSTTAPVAPQKIGGVMVPA
jgi:hypothetical protein